MILRIRMLHAKEHRKQNEKCLNFFEHNSIIIRYSLHSKSLSVLQIFGMVRGVVGNNFRRVFKLAGCNVCYRIAIG